MKKLKAKNIELDADFENLNDKEKVKIILRQNDDLYGLKAEINIYDRLLMDKERYIGVLKEALDVKEQLNNELRKENNQKVWNKVLNIIGEKVAKGSCENGCYEEMISELNEIQSYDGKQEIEQLKKENEKLRLTLETVAEKCYGKYVDNDNDDFLYETYEYITMSI